MCKSICHYSFYFSMNLFKFKGKALKICDYSFYISMNLFKFKGETLKHCVQIASMRKKMISIRFTNGCTIKRLTRPPSKFRRIKVAKDQISIDASNFDFKPSILPVKFKLSKFKRVVDWTRLMPMRFQIQIIFFTSVGPFFIVQLLAFIPFNLLCFALYMRGSMLS